MRRALFALLLLLPGLASLAYAALRVQALDPQMVRARIDRAGAMNAPCTLLLAGDSGMARWPLIAPPGWQVHRLGLSGASTATIAGPATAAIARLRPHLVVLHAGGNDAAGIAFLWGDRRRAAIAGSAARIAGITRAAQAQGARVVVLGLVPPTDQPWWRALLIGARQAEAMAAIEAATRLPAGTARLDTARLLGDPAAMRTDHLHYSASGYARIAAALIPYRAAACRYAATAAS
jgi:lysophospholipase L1-like esterase